MTFEVFKSCMVRVDLQKDRMVSSELHQKGI